MKIQALVTFEDKGEAARWLANYYTRAGSIRGDYRLFMAQEFPHDPRPDVHGDVIEAEALRMLANGQEGCANAEKHTNGRWPAAMERRLDGNNLVDPQGELTPLCYDCANLVDHTGSLHR